MIKEINQNTPVNFEVVKKYIEIFDARNIAAGNTRIMMRLIDKIESETGEKYIRMEIGVPGLSPSQIGIDAEINSHNNKIAGLYPPADGQPVLKKEISRFVKLFLNLDISPEYCIPTVGAINGCYASLMVTGRRIKEKNTVLFIDPGFPAHKQLVKMLGFQQDSFDVYYYRGKLLKDKLTEMLTPGNIAAIIYSNPNNPTWICFNEDELRIIGELSSKYDVTVIEDLSYFGMDFRKDYSHPGEPPFQPTVANYTDNFILLQSSSKIFSYAGQRIGMLIASEKLFNSSFENLRQYYLGDNFGNALVFGTILLTTGGVTQSVQFGLTEMLRKINDGEYNFIEEVKVYGERAKIMKKIFTENGFNIVYDMDGDEPIADGFYFTVAYPGFRGDELSECLLYYGISSIPLSSTGSKRIEGIRACVSLVHFEQMPLLEQRLKLFNEHYKI